MSKSEIRCTTQSCIKTIAEYGEHYHSVTAGKHFKAPPFMPDAVAVCERCGKDVEPGKLTGFFVPHRCSECDEKVVAHDKATGRVCTRCHQTYAYCCC